MKNPYLLEANTFSTGPVLELSLRMEPCFDEANFQRVEKTIVSNFGTIESVFDREEYPIREKTHSNCT